MRMTLTFSKPKDYAEILLATIFFKCGKKMLVVTAVKGLKIMRKL